MTPAPASGRTADENELRTGIVSALNTAFRGFSFPGGCWSTGYGAEMAADALLAGPIAHLRAENARLLERIRETEKGAEAMRERCARLIEIEDRQTAAVIRSMPLRTTEEAR